MKGILLIITLLLGGRMIAQNTVREQIDLCANDWRIWLDEKASWRNDTLYLPSQVKLAQQPYNVPTCGWDSLYSQKGVLYRIPASFEQIFAKGNPLFQYHGVGWISKEIYIPKEWDGRKIHLSIEKARQRIEIFVNERLCGYDLVAETPIAINIEKFVKPGSLNKIAFRITNPGGQRGWDDNPCIAWGNNYLLPPGHDFGGIGGDVRLTATNTTFITDVFVKNVLPAKGRNIDVHVTINNTAGESKNVQIGLSLVPFKGDGTPIYSKVFSFSMAANTQHDWKQLLQVPSALLWSVDSPNLYYCKLEIKNANNQLLDNYTQRFGFRTFEAVSNKEGQLNYYLNGERIRLKSAIDWGYYAQTGFFAHHEMALQSVQNAKAIGHNCISFHRRIGEPLVMEYADEMGLLIYEEPGGMPGIDGLHVSSWLQSSDKAFMAVENMVEKCRRMVLRDRNHPSVVVWSLSNEQNAYDVVHKKIFTIINDLDNSRMIVNQSGGQLGGASGFVPNIPPYKSMPNLQYVDDHTVDSKSRFQESDLFTHHTQNDSCIVHWGEVRCYTGPANWVQLAKLAKHNLGYDDASWQPMASKIEQYFLQNNFIKQRHIQSAADLPLQAGRGLMYTNGRLAQATLINNCTDGYAINGWSETNQSLGDDFLAWYSAICDEARNLKGPASDFAYWTRPLQIAVLRKNGKYFAPGDKVQLAIHLINEGKLPSGNYSLNIKVQDGEGKLAPFQEKMEVSVKGGDVHAQALFNNYTISLDSGWHAGYITILCTLLKNERVVATGTEQVLLRNRPSYKKQFELLQKKQNTLTFVQGWPGADAAFKEAGVKAERLNIQNLHKTKLIAVADIPSADTLKAILRAVRNGANCLIRFDSSWAALLYHNKILKQPVVEWGGLQKGFWNGNGWGYLDTYFGNQAIPSKNVIGTNSWEVSADPVGFFPFVSAFPQSVQGAFFARPSQLLTLLGTIQYEKGTLILLPGYPVDAQNAFNDLLFYEIVNNYIK